MYCLWKCFTVLFRSWIIFLGSFPHLPDSLPKSFLFAVILHLEYRWCSKPKFQLFFLCLDDSTAVLRFKSLFFQNYLVFCLVVLLKLVPRFCLVVLYKSLRWSYTVFVVVIYIAGKVAFPTLLCLEVSHMIWQISCSRCRDLLPYWCSTKVNFDVILCLWSWSIFLESWVLLLSPRAVLGRKQHDTFKSVNQMLHFIIFDLFDGLAISCRNWICQFSRWWMRVHSHA